MKECTDGSFPMMLHLLNKGINVLSGCGMQSDTKQKRDEALSLGESMTPEAQPIGGWVIHK
ncbi:hypothetical protein [Algoriphagus resistens]|uniref:hypothetical protein n=1 Tax=Algoriphagus resistens TaxID=1750590 RepID=UPI000AA70CC9|nr:hypothetical protein [Algoriphagus resistens]